MKKSFKRSIAVILSVLMVIASLPFSAFAASGEYHPNVVMQYGTIFDWNIGDTMHTQDLSDATGVSTYSALKGPALDYTNGTLALSEAKATPTANNAGVAPDDYTYTVGDYFTATVRVDDISQMAAFSMAVAYSDSIEPAGIYTADDGTASFYGISDTVPEGATLNYEAGKPLDFASVNAVYPGINGGLVGDISYINTTDKYIMAQAAATDGSDTVDVSVGTDGTEFTDPVTGEAGYTYAGQVPVATFMFKIVTEDPIEFTVYDSDNTKLPQYSGGFYVANDADGTAVEDYTTYATLDNAAGSTLLTLEGANTNSGVVTTEYTVVFKSYDGTVISSTTYAEGDTVVVPDLPTKAADADNHYSVAWDAVPSEVADADAVYTAVATPVAHTFDEGVVSGSNKVYTCTECGYQKTEEIVECTHNWVATGKETVITPATCQATGTKSVEYKCSLCGETKTETETIAKADHSFGEYVYNNDAVYNKTNPVDGTATATCSVCGEKSTKTIAGTGLLRVSTATVNLGAAVKLVVKMAQTRAAAFDDFYLVITYNNQEYKLEDEYIDGTGFAYDFDKIAPEYFADQLVLTMYGVKDGIVCKGHPVNYSIKQYCTSTYSKSATTDKLKTLLIEILYYGEADRVYRGHSGTLPSPIEGLTTEQTARHSTYVPTYKTLTDKYHAVNSGTNYVTWASVTMGLEGKVIPKFKFVYDPNVSNVNDFVFHIMIDGKDTAITYAEHPELFEATSAGSKYPGYKSYFVCCEVLDADQFRSPIDINATTADGTVVSDTLRYSVESYTSSSAYKNSTTLKNLVDQLLRYGRADAVYTGKAANYE